MSGRPRAGRCLRRLFRVPKDQIGYVRFIVESYEGLAQMTSVAGRGEVEWIIPPSRAEEADSLSRALATEVGLVPLGSSEPSEG